MGQTKRKWWNDGNGNERQLGAELRAEPQIGENLWTEICATRTTIKTGEEGQEEDPAVHFPLVGKTQLVLTREDGEVVLATIW